MPSEAPPGTPLDREEGRAFLALVLVALITGTLAPFSFGPVPRLHYLEFAAADILGNLLLTLPLGAVFFRRSRLLVVFGVAWLMLTIEIVQAWTPRVISPSDLVLNICGAALGHWLLGKARVRDLLRRLHPAHWPRGTALLGVAALVAGLWAGASTHAERISVSFSNWTPKPAYQLVLGNEVDEPKGGAERPFRGAIREIRLYAEELAPDAAFAPSPSLRLTLRPEAGGLVLAHHSQQGRLTREVLPPPEGFAIVADTDGYRLLCEGGRWLLPERFRDLLYEDFLSAPGLTLAVQLASHPEPGETQTRIFGWSNGVHYRNFSLGRKGPRYALRVRSTVGGLDGRQLQLFSIGSRLDHATLKPLASLSLPPEERVVASYGKRHERIFVDGRIRGHSFLARHTRGPLLNLLSGIWILSLALATALALAPSGKRRMLWTGVALAALGSFFVAAGWLEHLPLYGAPMLAVLMLAGLSAAAVLKRWGTAASGARQPV